MEKLNEVGRRVRVVWTAIWVLATIAYLVKGTHPILALFAPLATYAIWWVSVIPWYYRLCLSFATLGPALLPVGQRDSMDIALFTLIIGSAATVLLVVLLFILKPFFNKDR